MLLMNPHVTLPDIGLTPDEERAFAAWAENYFRLGCTLEPNEDGTAIIVKHPNATVAVIRPIQDFKTKI